MHPITLLGKTQQEEIPAAKPGKYWVFLEIDLVEYLRSHYTQRAIIEERQKPYVRVYKTGQRRECKPRVDMVNRFLITLRTALYKVRNEWEWIDRVPRVKALKGAVNRIPWITRVEADALITSLPAHLAVMTEFSLQTGLRRANVTHREWRQVDRARKTAWIPAGKAKNRKAGYAIE
jgi:integrase